MTAPHTPPAAPDLAAIEARAAAATPGPWTMGRVRHERYGDFVAAFSDECDVYPPEGESGPVCATSEAEYANADFIAHARADVPTLLAHVRRLTAALADSDARVASAVAAARDDERERAASVAESHAIDCDLDAEDERTNGTLGGCTVAQDRAKLARMIRDGIRKPACTICEEPATCFGSSEGDPPSYHCDDCCGHGGEDGHCEPVGADAIATTPATGGAQ